jgi:hypothetical protein
LKLGLWPQETGEWTKAASKTIGNCRNWKKEQTHSHHLPSLPLSLYHSIPLSLSHRIPLSLAPSLPPRTLPPLELKRRFIITQVSACVRTAEIKGNVRHSVFG